jgi:hypothetical protein
MDDINAKILVKQKQVQVEQDAEKKAEYQKQLKVLMIRKRIVDLQDRIERI